MKFGLFLALLVLLAATDVFGQSKARSGRRPSRPIGDDNTDSVDETRPVNRVRVSSKSGGRFPDDATDEDRETFDRSGKKINPDSVTVVVPTSLDREQLDKSIKKSDRDSVTVVVPTSVDREQSDNSIKKSDRDSVPVVVSRPLDREQSDNSAKKINPDSVSVVAPRPLDREDDDRRGRKNHQATNDIEEDGEQHLSVDRVSKLDRKPDTDRKDIIGGPIHSVRPPVKSVHVHGNIVLVKHRPSVVDPVQYDLDGSLTVTDRNPKEIRPVSPYARNFLARGSQVTLYVSTSKTTDREQAFAKFPIKYGKGHFPLTFDLEIDLPNKQLGLLERADITLYFFVYITDSERLIDTFLPTGTSQVILQGTDRNIRPLDVFVRTNGIAINGLFRGRFSERLIQPGTVFQVLVVDEMTLLQKSISAVDAVGQLTISNVPAMYPVPFSFVVSYQMLKPKTKYYAVAYIFENGVRRLLNRKPVWIINEEKLAVTTQLLFTVIPSPFILKGTVTRSMPGTVIVQPGSSIVLTLHAINTNEPDIVFRIPQINTFPQRFAVNVSQSSRFDPSKNYEISAQITDKNNDIYMTSLQAIQIGDDIENIILPVDDYLYYVNVRLQSSTNQPLTFVPGSNVQVLLTETPETPSKPVVSMAIEHIENDFRDFTFKIPTTGVQRNRNYYLVMMVEVSGIITHVSKVLLISNNQPPPLSIQLPVISLNLIRGVITDVDQRQAQWSSSAYAKLYLLDDTISDLDNAIVQSWTIHLENDFPIRFEVELDFSRLHFGRTYRLQAAIENGHDVIEYKPANSVIAIGKNTGIRSDVRVFVRNVKVFQTVKGLIYIYGVQGPLPENSEMIIQISSSPSVTNPKIVDERRIKVSNRTLPIDFLLELPINKIDINAVYYFLVQYTVRGSVVIAATQAYAFSPRNQATVVIALSKTPQVSIVGQVTSTGSPLDLPRGAVLHLFITDSVNNERPTIISEVYLQSTPNSLYDFRMYVDSLVLNRKTPLYLRGEVIYDDTVILRMPRPALLQLTPGSEWNINLVIDLPTLVIGEIVSLTNSIAVQGEFDVYIQVLETSSKQVVHTIRLRLGAKLPQRFRIEIDNSLFVRYTDLKIRALIKNCKEETLYESGNELDIHIGLNLNAKLIVAINDIKKLTELRPTIDETASYYTGKWQSSITGTVNQATPGELITVDDI